MIKIKTKSYNKIKKTLDKDSIIHHGEHDELYFAKQMIGFCGKTIDIRHQHILDNFCDFVGKNMVYTSNWTWHYKWIESIIYDEIDEIEFLFLINFFDGDKIWLK